MEQATMATVSDGEGLSSCRQNRRQPPAVPTGYAEMIEAVRLLQDRIAAAAPDEELIAAVTRDLTHAAELLAPAEREEAFRISGFSEELPGNGSALIPLVWDVVSDASVRRGRVRFGSFHLGENGAAHGGTIPLLFDEVLGRFANSDGRASARTAYLHVDYRSVTPVEKDLEFVVRFEREEGRKRYMTGALRDGERVCAEVEGLFVQLRPGQP
ncbi:PaaI family thioesterase [Streptomyces carpinensis]|uniref:Acyl-coenzyme A thioesterase THEM4 n=1 Tax=Streptomyces carpinensis TaxID=66369 RepID=A0ABV1VWM0_9ACTN|nr:PaaI family thioesterase [Streptomyces carpinensis]